MACVGYNVQDKLGNGTSGTKYSQSLSCFTSKTTRGYYAIDDQCVFAQYKSSGSFYEHYLTLHCPVLFAAGDNGTNGTFYFITQSFYGSIHVWRYTQKDGMWGDKSSRTSKTESKLSKTSIDYKGHSWDVYYCSCPYSSISGNSQQGNGSVQISSSDIDNTYTNKYQAYALAALKKYFSY